MLGGWCLQPFRQILLVDPLRGNQRGRYCKNNEEQNDEKTDQGYFILSEALPRLLPWGNMFLMKGRIEFFLRFCYFCHESSPLPVDASYI